MLVAPMYRPASSLFMAVALRVATASAIVRVAAGAAFAAVVLTVFLNGLTGLNDTATGLTGTF